MAEEVGVEPTSHVIRSSTALKAARPTGDDALPTGSIEYFQVFYYFKNLLYQLRA